MKRIELIRVKSKFILYIRSMNKTILLLVLIVIGCNTSRKMQAIAADQKGVPNGHRIDKTTFLDKSEVTQTQRYGKPRIKAQTKNQ